MRRVFSLLAIFLSVAVGCSFMACSNEDNLIQEPNIETEQETEENEIIDPEATGSRDFSTLRKAASGSISITYTPSDYHLYCKDKYTNDQWEEIDLYDYIGWEANLPGTINIKDGRSWTRYSMFSLSIGPNELYLPWYAYCKVTGEKRSLYVATPILLDEESFTITMNGKTFEIPEASGDGFKLSYKTGYRKGGDDTIGTHLEINTYLKGDLDSFDESQIIWYESERDLIVDICSKIRSELGDQFNLNNYLAPDIELDDPMVDMDEVENALLSRLSD
jgi:hypothetical protein